MAWYDAIIGPTNPSPPPNPYIVPGGNLMSIATTAAGSISQTNSAQNYWATANSTVMQSVHQDKMYTIKHYADAIGWSLTHHVIPAGVTSDDPKIAMLKLLNVGEVLKDVGVRTSDTDYYIMRAPDA